MDEFWMVWHEGDRGPTQKHESPDDAEREAERLCRKHGGRFYVLRATNTVTVAEHEPPLDWAALSPVTPF